MFRCSDLPCLSVTKPVDCECLYIALNMEEVGEQKVTFSLITFACHRIH